MSAQTYKRLEQIIVAIMLLGIVAMFQPWFRDIVEIFEPLAPAARLGRTYKNEIAPIVLRVGFYSAFLGTVAFIVISHYSYKDLSKAAAQKGTLLTILLVVVPVLYGFLTIANLAWAYYLASFLGVFNVVFAIALWNKRLWGLVGLGLTALIELGLALFEMASLPTSSLLLVIAIILFALAWPKRTTALNQQP